MENTFNQTALDEKMNELSADKRELLELLLGGANNESEPETNDSNLFVSELENDLKEIWETVLSIGKIKPTNNFFELGGDSLHCIQIVAKARKQNIHFSTADVFETQTIEKLARKIAVKTALETAPNETESGERFADAGLNNDELAKLFQQI
jgi:acyl carrier protein